MENFKAEQWDAKRGNRMTRDHWEENGSLDIRARAREQYKKIRDTHQPKPLDPDVLKKLQQIVDKAEA
jgi:trimethylamine:corrinoid methyltransferase-like protein